MKNNIFSFMKKVNWNAIPIAINGIGKFGRQHAPTILTILGVSGFWAAGVSAALSVPKVEEAIEQESVRRDENGEEPMDRLDKYKIYAKCYAPAIATATVSSCLIFGANKINLSRITAMTALYTSSRNELIALKDRVVEHDADGLKKGDFRKARHEMHKNDYENNPVVNEKDVRNTRFGDTLFIDSYSGVRFHSSIAAVNSAITWLNTKLMDENYVELSEFYDALELPARTQKCGKYAAFRLNTMKDVIYPDQILDWHEYVDPTTGEPKICYIDFARFLTPSDEFIAHNPW